MFKIKREIITPRDASREAKLTSLKRSLQTAIELEHSTIPPYLYAIYSIRPGTNAEIAALILSVVKEEMLHLSLDCNVLNAVGGHPLIDDPHFIPHYPGHLPGGVESSLVVGLAPFSKQIVNDVFSAIEEPEEPITGEPPPPSDELTIGEFYESIKETIRELSAGGNIFTGDPRKQVTTGFRELQHLAVTNEETAIAALDLIVRQGEGSSTSPLDPERELAHYYKYQEIYFGRKLIRNPEGSDPPWVYLGHEIVFDAAGILPVITNPSRATYANSRELRGLNDTFNHAYTMMLKGLHHVFNGHPDELGPALLRMQWLKAQAQVMMATPIVPGLTAGPTFDYTPKLPET